jgi:hypothetical protein
MKQRRYEGRWKESKGTKERNQPFMYISIRSDRCTHSSTVSLFRDEKQSPDFCMEMLMAGA